MPQAPHRLQLKGLGERGRVRGRTCSRGHLRQTAVVDALCGRAGILGHGAKLALALLVLSRSTHPAKTSGHTGQAPAEPVSEGGTKVLHHPQGTL